MKKVLFCIKKNKHFRKVSEPWVMVLHGHRDGFCYSSWNCRAKGGWWWRGHLAASFKSSILTEMLWFKSVMSKKQNQILKGENEN